MKRNSGLKRKHNKAKELEKIYLKYLVPMSSEEWKSVRSLEQPTLLKQVPTKTSFSSGN